MVGIALPAIQRSGGAVLTGAGKVDERVKTQINIIETTYNNSTYDVITWTKNVGALVITGIENCDILFGKQGNFTRISRGTGEGQWNSIVEEGGDWEPAKTVRFTLNYTSPLPRGLTLLEYPPPMASLMKTI